MTGGCGGGMVGSGVVGAAHNSDCAWISRCLRGGGGHVHHTQSKLVTRGCVRGYVGERGVGTVGVKSWEREGDCRVSSACRVWRVWCVLHERGGVWRMWRGHACSVSRVTCVGIAYLRRTITCADQFTTNVAQGNLRRGTHTRYTYTPDTVQCTISERSVLK